jgi:glycosyltransferase involved in cell wall biosynthesis
MNSGIWLTPNVESTKCAIVVTHYNYSHLIESALRSVKSQTHINFECIIVDDASSSSHKSKVASIVRSLDDGRFRLLKLPKNKGQTPAIFAGLEATTANFVALLDPDDVYEPDFLGTMLRAHLNSNIVAALACCEMGVFSIGKGIVSRETTGFNRRANPEQRTVARQNAERFGYSRYFAPWEPGWHWASTSSMVFRRDALATITPFEFPKEVKFNGDSYCAHGAHMLGGTLFLDRVLSWRGVHEDNTARVRHHFSSTQSRLKKEFVDFTAPLKVLAMDSALRHGAWRYFTATGLAEILNAHFNREQLGDLLRRNEIAYETIVRSIANVGWEVPPASTG